MSNIYKYVLVIVLEILKVFKLSSCICIDWYLFLPRYNALIKFVLIDNFVVQSLIKKIIQPETASLAVTHNMDNLNFRDDGFEVRKNHNYIMYS